MEQWIECVPNFSEGRRPEVIATIARAVSGTPGVYLLHTDIGAAANRTVFTFLGPPAAVTEAAFNAIAAAARLIDMRQQLGVHPRIGATDVCPLIPLAGISMAEMESWVHRLAERVGRELDIPVYLYENSASRPERRSLADVRRGQYEGLAARLQQPDWQPDYGPAAFNARTGATVIGARPFLVAYNINLATRDAGIARRIAAELRTTGRRDRSGQQIPGQFRGLKAIGWYIEEYERAQVSTNVTDFTTAPLHEVFEACRERAVACGTTVTGSELIGMVPLRALLPAGRFYRPQVTDAAQLVEAAAAGLNLTDVVPFSAREKVIEFRLQDLGGPVLSL